MAVRPIKSITELGEPSLLKLYRNCREISNSHIFCNLFMAGVEHFILYLKGKGLEQFVSNALSLIHQTQTEDFRENYKESFEDLDMLYDKKQIKIFNALLYDLTFANFLYDLQEMLEIPDCKTSENENMNAIQFYANKMRINVLILTKTSEVRYCVEDYYVCVVLYYNSNEFFVVYPYEYRLFTKEAGYLSDSDDMEDMRKHHESDVEDDEEFLTVSAFANKPIIDIGLQKMALERSIRSPKNIRADPKKSEAAKKIRQRSRVMKEKRIRQEEKRRMTTIVRKADDLLSPSFASESDKCNSSSFLSRFPNSEVSDLKALEEENVMLKEWKAQEERRMNIFFTPMRPSRHFEFSEIEEPVLTKALTEDEILGKDFRNFDAKNQVNIEINSPIIEEITNKEKNRKSLEELQEQKYEKQDFNIENDQARNLEQQKMLKNKLPNPLLEEKKNEIRAIIAIKRKEAEDRRNEEEMQLMEQRKHLEEMRLNEEMQKTAEKSAAEKLIQEKRLIEEQRQEIERKLSEERRLAAEKRLEEARKLYEEKKTYEEKRITEERKLVEDLRSEIEKRFIDKRRQNEQKRLDEEYKFPEAQKVLADKIVANDKRFDEEKKAFEDKRKIDEKKIVLEELGVGRIKEKNDEKYKWGKIDQEINDDQDRLDEEVRNKELSLAEEQRIEQEKIAEEERLEEEARLEKKRVAQEQYLEKLKIAQERKLAEEKIEAEKKQKIEERKRLAEERKKAEEKRLEDEKKAEEKRLADEKKAEEKRLADEKEAEEKRVADEKRVEELRIAKEKAKIEEKSLAEEKKIADEKRQIEEKKREADERRKAEENRKQDEKKQVEEKRLAEEKRKAEERRLAEVKRAEEDRKQAELKRKQAEEERQAKEKKLSDQRKLAEEKKKQAEDLRKQAEARMKEETKSKAQEEYQDTENTSYCGGLYCQKCTRELKRSNYLLKCDLCCDNYLKTNRIQSTAESRPPTSKNCMNCSAKITKGEEVYCICCFLKVKILEEQTSGCSGCCRLDKCYWIDASEGEARDMILCGFCDETKNKESIITICTKCNDKICLVCLRKNPYVSQGICSSCHNRRQVSL